MADMYMSKRKDILYLAGIILLCFIAGAFGSLFTYRSLATWYKQLYKPPFQPPNWVFAPVWTFLYLSMAVSFWLVWKKRNVENIKSLTVLFFIQVILNALWTPLFFGWHQVFPAFLLLLVLTILVGAYALHSWKVSKPASLLFLPYWLWLCFASYLNFTIWLGNK